MSDERSAERWLIVAGGSLLSVAAFVPWIHVLLLGSVNLLQLLSLAKENPALGVLPTGIGVAIILIELLAGGSASGRASVLVMGTLFALISTSLTINLVHAVGQAGGWVGISLGPFVTAAGCALTIVPALVGLMRRTDAPEASGARPPRRPMPAWLPLAISIPACLALALFPLQSAGGGACGAAVSVVTRQPQAVPTAHPPVEVQTRLDADQASVDAATTALATQQQTNQASQAKQAAATSLADLASSAEDAAAQATTQVSQDEDTISNDQNDIDNANNQMVTDQDQLQMDQDGGYDTSSDTASIQQDRKDLGHARQTLKSDQTTLTRDRAKAAALDHEAAVADQKATNAGSDAEADSRSSNDADTIARSGLSQAQAILDHAQGAWATEHAAASQAVIESNSLLADCQGQAHPRLAIAGMVLLTGLAGGGALAVSRRDPKGPDLLPLQPTG